LGYPFSHAGNLKVVAAETVLGRVKNPMLRILVGACLKVN
jgi:hypothetical protein